MVVVAIYDGRDLCTVDFRQVASRVPTMTGVGSIGLDDRWLRFSVLLVYGNSISMAPATTLIMMDWARVRRFSAH